jgi:taurine dioxygenase
MNAVRQPISPAFSPIPGSAFGVSARLPRGSSGGSSQTAVEQLEGARDALQAQFYGGGGFMVLHGADAISENPPLLLRLSELFGEEVEDYRTTPAARHQIHDDVPQIFIVANRPPANKPPPARPEPPFTDTGGLPTRFPHRRGWHTDQSYRRPPPDVSLFYAVQPAPPGGGETLYASGTLAYAALPKSLMQRVEGLVGLHCSPGKGRAEYAVRAGEAPAILTAAEQPQRQNVVRVHPVTGQPALFLCEAGQMDWIDGPFEGMEPGIDGDGAALLYELMTHYTRDEFVYVHRWEAGDLVVYDNRNLIHAATWFDADQHSRIMWRTTVWGNPGPEFDGEQKSWLMD